MGSSRGAGRAGIGRGSGDAARGGAGDPDDGSGDWYARPSWYDILHAAGTAWEVDVLERIERTVVKGPARADRVWLEPACGTGRVLRVAGRRGRRVVGIDNTPEMVEYARRRLSALGLGSDRARVLLGDMREFESPWRADFAVCTINSIRHLPDDASMLRHLGAMAAALRPDGAYVVGLGVDQPGWSEPMEDIWRGRRGRLSITQTVQYLPPDRAADGGDGAVSREEVVISHLTIQTPTRLRSLDTRYVLRTWPLEAWRSIIDRSGLRLHAVADDRGVIAPGGLEEQIRAAVGVRLSTYAHWVLRPRDGRAG